MKAEHTALFGGILYPELISLVCFSLQTEFFQHERIAENVVQVQMCVQQMFHLELIAFDEVFQGLFLFFVETAWVNDYCFVGFIP